MTGVELISNEIFYNIKQYISIFSNQGLQLINDELRTIFIEKIF